VRNMKQRYPTIVNGNCPSESNKPIASVLEIDYISRCSKVTDPMAR
jgi:hypothetical protein